MTLSDAVLRLAGWLAYAMDDFVFSQNVSYADAYYAVSASWLTLHLNTTQWAVYQCCLVSCADMNRWDYCPRNRQLRLVALLDCVTACRREIQNQGEGSGPTLDFRHAHKMLATIIEWLRHTPGSEKPLLVHVFALSFVCTCACRKPTILPSCTTAQAPNGGRGGRKATHSCLISGGMQM